ncbi:hypothetical protein AHAS_Ahas13G0249100 [Arachis hypogaea]
MGDFFQIQIQHASLRKGTRIASIDLTLFRLLGFVEPLLELHFPRLSSGNDLGIDPTLFRFYSSLQPQEPLLELCFHRLGTGVDLGEAEGILDFGRGKIMSTYEHDVKTDSDNDLGDFDYESNAHDDVEDDDVDSLDSTSKSEQDCSVKRIAILMVENIWNLEFRTEDEACQFYNAYACWHGFVMRKDDVVKDKEGKIICRQLVCNKEGWRNMMYLDLDNRSREARSLMETKCPARLKIKVDYGCGRWKTCHIMGYIAFQKGRYRHAGFTRKDLYNHIDGYHRSKVKNEDANAAINYLIGKLNNDPLFFGKYTFTSDQRLEHIFWADGQSIVDYHWFGDIIAFDSTYKKNKYSKPLVIFSGCNHHGQTVIFGSGLLSDETTDMYKWLLEMFVEAMGGNHPKAVIIDED